MDEKLQEHPLQKNQEANAQPGHTAINGNTNAKK